MADFRDVFRQVSTNMTRVADSAYVDAVGRVTDLLHDTFAGGGKLLVFGNGGSSADAQHLSAELVGRFARDRAPLPAIALTTNQAILTAWSNDHAFEDVFARQVEALGHPGDLAWGISTSGTSPNVVNGLRRARERGLRTVGLTGESGGTMAEFCDVLLAVPLTNTARIQEVHLVTYHAICAALEERLFRGLSALPFALFATAALAAWVARRARAATAVPGSGAFYCLMAAVAAWCATSGIHGLAGSLEWKILWAKIQYGAICSVPPLWFLFAAEYADLAWMARQRAKIALWIIPVLTILAAWTNEWHGAVWPAVSLTPAGVTVYEHGTWFWIAASYNYLLVLGGAAQFIRALRTTPPPFRSQWVALIVAALVPLAGNAAYIFGLTIPGLDPTPIAFTVSGLLFIRALHRDRLFELVPVARDTVIESLSDAVIVLDGSKRVLDMNAAARAIAGNPPQWTGKPIGALMPLLRDLRVDVVTDWSTTLTHQLPEAQAKYFDVRVIRVRTRRGHAAASVILLRDISEQLRAEAERSALAARVQEQQKRESLSVLAGGLAHDFNNLLTGIVGNADLLSLHIPPSSDMGHSVGAILLGAQRAADLVDKMLAYAGERHGSIERVDLNALVGDMVDLMRASAARHCRLDYEGEAATIEGDATQIRQVIMNLIINAADVVHEPSGRIGVKVGAETLTIAELRAVECADDAVPGEYAYLDVEDNGPGIGEATLARIFQPFFTTKPTGHGLGLAAVQGIVHGHRGALRVRSVVGAGTAFRVWFPLAPAMPEAAPPDPQSAQSHTSAPVRTP